MRQVIITIGPQGAGKSTFCKKIVELLPSFKIVSRDEILIKLFNTVWLDSYSGGHYLAYQEMFKELKIALKPKTCLVILDCWTGYAEERSQLTTLLKNKLNVDYIIGWQFVTEEDTCVKWFFEKEHKTRISESAVRRNYQLFHQQPVSLNQGFDLIKKINPVKGAPKPEDILKLCKK